jgi:hypothetical protein
LVGEASGHEALRETREHGERGQADDLPQERLEWLGPLVDALVDHADGHLRDRQDRQRVDDEQHEGPHDPFALAPQRLPQQSLP